MLIFTCNSVFFEIQSYFVIEFRMFKTHPLENQFLINQTRKIQSKSNIKFLKKNCAFQIFQFIINFFQIKIYKISNFLLLIYSFKIMGVQKYDTELSKFCKNIKIDFEKWGYVLTKFYIINNFSNLFSILYNLVGEGKN